MLRPVLLTALLTGVFCAGFAVVIDWVTDMLERNPVAAISFVSGFLGSLFAQITDIVGGRSGAYEKSLAEARDTALRELQERAVARGGNAVVGVDLDYEVINNMLMVSASGTAVVLD